MLRSKLAAFAVLAGVGLSSPAALLGQAGPFNGAGELKLYLNSISAGDRVEVRVDVDISDVLGRRGNGTPGTALSGSESLTIELESVSAIVYGATTDNRTQDPTLQYARLLPVE